MNRKNLWQLLAIWIASILVVGLLGFYTRNSVDANENSIDRLQIRDVLVIIARPLPENSPHGYFLANANLHRAVLDYADLEKAMLRNADLSDAQLEGVNLDNANLGGANFSNADLRLASMSNSFFVEARLTGAILFMSNLSYSNFQDADFSNADFSLALLEGAVLPDGSVYVAGDDLVTRFGAAANP